MKEKVLLISSGGLSKSGVPTVLMTIVDGLKDSYEFDILLHTSDQGYYDQQFLSYGGRIFRCPKKHFGFKPLDRIAEMLRPALLRSVTKKIIRNNGPYKVIHCNNDFDASGCLEAAKKERIPIRICHTHKTWKSDSQMGPLTRIYRMSCRKVILDNATALIGCSSDANSSTFGSSARTQVVFNPYDENRFTPVLPLRNPNGLNLIQIGYLNDNKNQLFSIKVLKELRENRPDVHLTLVGRKDGEYAGMVEKKIQEYNLQNAVTMLPADADIAKAMEQSSILLFPSRYEGFGIVLIEAQAMGLHCLASDTVPQETDRGGVEFISLSEGPEAWADFILSHSNLLEKRVKDCTPFSTKTFIDTIRKLYSNQ